MAVNLVDAQAAATHQHINRLLVNEAPGPFVARDPWPALTTFTTEYLYHPDHDPAHVQYDPEANTVRIGCFNGSAAYALEAIDDDPTVMLGRLQPGSKWRVVG